MTDHDSIMSRELFIASFAQGRSTKLLARAMPRLVRAMTDVHVRAGEALFRVGEPAHSVYFIASGHVDVIKRSIRNSYGERSVVGTSDVLLERARTQDAIASSDLHALELPVMSWLEILEDNPEAAMAAINGIAAAIDALHVERDLDATSDPDVAAESEPLPSAVPSLVDRLVTLRSADAFRRARIQTLASLTIAAREIQLAAGERLFAHDATRHAHYVVAHGEIETTRVALARVARFGAGSLVMGVASFVRRAAFDAVATRASTVLRLSDEDVFDISEDHFDLARSMLMWLEEQRDAAVVLG